MSAFAANLSAPETCEDRANQRRERNDEIGEFHAALIPSTCRFDRHRRIRRCGTARQDRQTNRRLGRRDREDEEHEDLPAEVAEVAGKAMKLRFTASSISSIAISRMMTFRRLMNMPITLIVNSSRRDDQVGVEWGAGNIVFTSAAEWRRTSRHRIGDNRRLCRRGLFAVYLEYAQRSLRLTSTCSPGFWYRDSRRSRSVSAIAATIATSSNTPAISTA